MAWDPTPWMIGGGAEHSPEVGRLVSYVATSGAEGIINADDLKVAELTVPSTSVRIAPGAALIRNRSTGAASETYAARLPAEDTVEIAATGTGAGRSDLIVARIEDPFLAGAPWQEPADPTTGQYVYTRVISNVPAGTTRLQQVAGYENHSALTLARIDIPASTGTIIDDYIIDLRKIAVPRTEPGSELLFPAGDRNMSKSGYTSWPIATSINVEVPEWATEVRIVAHVSGVQIIGGSGESYGGVRTKFGSHASQNGIILGPAGRQHISIIGKHPILSSQRGQVVPIALEGYQTDGGTGTIQADYQTTVAIEWEFKEAPQ
jgi:hypothetical protein